MPPDFTELPVFNPQRIGKGWHARLRQSATDGAGIPTMEAESGEWKMQLPFYLLEPHFILSPLCFTQSSSWWPACYSTATSGPSPDTRQNTSTVFSTDIKILFSLMNAYNSLQFYCLDQIKTDIRANSNTQIGFMLNIYDSLVLIQ